MKSPVSFATAAVVFAAAAAVTRARPAHVDFTRLVEIGTPRITVDDCLNAGNYQLMCCHGASGEHHHDCRRTVDPALCVGKYKHRNCCWTVRELGQWYCPAYIAREDEPLGTDYLAPDTHAEWMPGQGPH